MFRHFLVPTDGSELSDEAVKRAVSMAKETNAKITFFTARPNTQASAYGETALLRSLDPDLLKKTVLDRADSILAKGETLAEASGVSFDALSSASTGEPYEGILAAAEDQGCDLILMASHGYSGMKGFLLGSQTMKVLTHSTIPVLVYR